VNARRNDPNVDGAYTWPTVRWIFKEMRLGLRFGRS
jgi:hypothetical protein